MRDGIPLALRHKGAKCDGYIGGKKQRESEDGTDLFPAGGPDSLPFMGDGIRTKEAKAQIAKS